MKGINRIELNAATMLQAMQLWLDANFKHPPTATGIRQNADTFRLTTTAEPPAKTSAVPYPRCA